MASSVLMVAPARTASSAAGRTARGCQQSVRFHSGKLHRAAAPADLRRWDDGVPTHRRCGPGDHDIPAPQKGIEMGFRRAHKTGGMAAHNQRAFLPPLAYREPRLLVAAESGSLRLAVP